MAKVLVVDDDKSIRKTLKDILEFEKYSVEEAADGVECIVKLKQANYDIVILDIKMPKMDGMEVLDKIQSMNLDVPVVMISGHANIDTAVEAVKKGAFDFIQKPPDLNRLLITIRNAMDKSNLITQTKVLKKKASKASLQEIIGESEPILEVHSLIDRMAPTDARVLIHGQNGTGKELVARWIHAKSQRAKGPIIEVNCAAIPSELIESELFGHEKGSFTSAHKMRIGKFEQAHEGTLFLDEIGDMSLSAQAKVLRALQENKITRVGGDKDIAVNVRILAATNKDLRQEIAKGRFREDLYHRLAVMIIQVPSLNERQSDIPLLVDHFAEQIAQEYGMPQKKFGPSAVRELKKMSWTGNIRELRNVVERLMILCSNAIGQKDIQNYAVPQHHSHVTLSKLIHKFNTVEELQAYVSEEFEKVKGLLAS